MRLLTCAGGTGGGVYPALTVLQALIQRFEMTGKELQGQDLALALQWVGGVGGMEADIVLREGVPFETIPAAGVHGVGFRALAGNLWQLAKGLQASRRILNHFQPDVLFFTGGYVAFPMALAGKVERHRIPQVLYVPDIEPGLALRNLARFADVIAVTTEESRTYFPKHARVVMTGYPVRSELSRWSVEQARRVLKLSPDLLTLLVFGGSTGARSINRALLAALPELLDGRIQIIHLSGQRDWDEVQAAAQTLTVIQAEHYHFYSYLHEEMGAALRAADLVVSRAGASCLGEYPAFGLPAILVPYPHAWRYQKVNAEYMARRGAAVILDDADLPNQLVAQVRSLLYDQTRLAQMRSAMQRVARPGAAEHIADLINDLALKR